MSSVHRHSDDEENMYNQIATQSNKAAIRDATNGIGRRQLLRGLIVSSTFKSIAAEADDSSSLMSPRPSAISNSASKSAICDPTVESYRKRSNQIHIVGTAHISSESSQLSRAAVRETKPDAVFIELDLQRISRAFRNGQINRPITILFFTGESPGGGGNITLQSAILAPQNLEKRSRGVARLLEKMTLKNPIQEMYEGLEARGITAGAEVRSTVIFDL